MKNKGMIRVSFVLENDKTGVFSEMATKNFEVYILKMIDVMGDDFERYLKDKKYINELMEKIIETTKPDFIKWMCDNDIGGCSFFIDEVMKELKYSYGTIKKIYSEHKIQQRGNHHA
ncbi:hypothetical protein EK69_001599 [Salmonella enterica subsp. enterica]|nr:hypothetical protein [Salmonella enterica subsp. enterica serovar Baguida]